MKKIKKIAKDFIERLDSLRTEIGFRAIFLFSYSHDLQRRVARYTAPPPLSPRKHENMRIAYKERLKAIQFKNKAQKGMIIK